MSAAMKSRSITEERENGKGMKCHRPKCFLSAESRAILRAISKADKVMSTRESRCSVEKLESEI